MPVTKLSTSPTLNI